MGEMTDLVSQFYVSSLYTQINYNNEVMRVTPLEYSGLIKYFTNRETIFRRIQAQYRRVASVQVRETADI